MLANNYTIFVNVHIFDRGTMGSCKCRSLWHLTFGGVTTPPATLTTVRCISSESEMAN